MRLRGTVSRDSAARVSERADGTECRWMPGLDLDLARVLILNFRGTGESQ
jgi:hypothetical protein